jgi:hypothetical protein
VLIGVENDRNHQLVTNLSQQAKSLVTALRDQQLSAAELQLVTKKPPAFP